MKSASEEMLIGSCLMFFCSTGDKCVLSFKPCGMFGKELHKVEGYIQDKRFVLTLSLFWHLQCESSGFFFYIQTFKKLA